MAKEQVNFEVVATEIIPYRLSRKVIATDTGCKTMHNTWIQVEAKLVDAPEAVIEALECGLIGEDSEVFNHHAGLGNATNTFTLQYADGSTQTYENCSCFELEYDASTVSFPLFFSMQLDGELSKEQAEIETHKLLQGVKLDGISLGIQFHKIGLEYEFFNLEVVNLVCEADMAAQC